ncbi:hypothetical protein ACGFY6_06725 [Streptomyces sp. NPDC048387]|uniref:hypothetical protein n=1 Tax=Streptomyces sp. NPDC048387 TaxID=3365542 RepID=UPI00371F3295
MPTRPHARPFQPFISRSILLFLALLLAALSCPSPTYAHVANGSWAAGAVLQSGPTGAEGHPHPGPAHGFACSPCDAAPATRPETPLAPAAARPQAAPGPVPAAVRAGPAGARGSAATRSGRSTLTIVCRWRL